MGEIKQTNFRVDQESADAFRKFCEENGMNQAQGFDHMMQVMELNRAKTMIPGSAKDIETFEMYMKKVMESYLKSVEDYNTAHESAKEEFISALTSKDKTIGALQEKVAQLQEEKKIAEQTAISASQTADQAIKEASVAKTQAETASKLAEEKDKTIANMLDKLSIVEEKAVEYDDLKKSEETARGKIIELQKDMERQKVEADRKLKASQEEAERALKAAQDMNARELAELKKDHATEIRELKTDMERKISDAQKDAALLCANEVVKKEREMNALLREADRENARLQVQLESLQDKIAELTVVSDKAKSDNI
ncbi:alanine-zipper protein [Blautia sp. MSJ-9]|uniref:alanine-zipper protein n=1 Tax=Blautia sp. MSJ-9 TaxID=2841511 RepID=UPI001C106358|nr:alanine-zipper protein [Blautia sp. MSJ-9]MBU5679004.1 hypothetical protein [Blautia sp. MSJ-9]